MEHAREHGLAVPEVFRVDGADLEMERLDGSTMLRGLLNGDISINDAAAILAGLHNRLHALPPLAEGCILHLDLHPENVILAAHGPVLIDWRNATHGPADLDVALTALILAQAATGTIDPANVGTSVLNTDATSTSTPAAVTRLMVAFLASARGDPGRMLDKAVAYRGRDPNLSSKERDGLSTAASFVRAHLPPRHIHRAETGSCPEGSQPSVEA